MSINVKASSTSPSGWREAASQGVGALWPLSIQAVCPTGGRMETVWDAGLGDGEDETDLGLRPAAESLTGGDKDELLSAWNEQTN